MGHCDLADIMLESGGYLAEFSSVRGGVCYRLFHKTSGREILRTPESEDALRENAFLYGNPVLFPPNRIRGGVFRFRRRVYRFPVNEPSTGSHLHGELYRKPFDVSEKTNSRAVFSFHADAGEYLGFPHAFSVIRAYTLDERGLTETCAVENCSAEEMPFLLAFHTTFMAEGCTLRQAVRREQLRDSRFLPTGVYCENARGRAITAGTYRVGEEPLSALYEASGNTAYLASGDAVVCYRASSDYRYRMLFAPAGAGFLCFEPQTCAIDCFHLPESPEQSGLITLCPGERKTLQTTIWMQR